MTKLIKNFLLGAGRVFIVYGGPEYVRPTRQDLRNDAARLSKDARRLAGDMRAALRYGEQVDYRKG